MAPTGLIKREFSIGRNQGLVDIVIDSEAASDRHAKVTIMDNGTLLLEDLRSSNGTYVNGERIRSKVVSLVDRIKIGGKEFVFRDHFRTENDQIKSFRPLNDFTAEFAQLEYVYVHYHTAKEKIKNQQSTNRFVRSSLPILSPLIGVGFTLVSGKDEGSTMKIIPPVITTVLGFILVWFLDSPAVHNRREKKIAQIDSDHRKNFICPKCHRPFERLTWEQVAAQKVHGCGAILAR